MMARATALLQALLLAPLAGGQTGDDCTAACEADCMEGDGDCAITFQAQLLAWQADSVASDPGGFLASWSTSTRPCDDWGSTVVCASNAANGVREPLQRLNLMNSDMTATLSGLGVLTPIRNLRLYGTESARQDGITGDLSELTNLVNLREIDIRFTAVVGSLSSLSGLSQLRDLNLRDVAGVTGALSSLPSSVQEVNLRGTQATGDAADIAALGSLNNIHLDCAGSWSACTAACEAADARSWTETLPASGNHRN